MRNYFSRSAKKYKPIAYTAMAAVIIIASCTAVKHQPVPPQDSAGKAANNGELVFQSGFEADCRIIKKGGENDNDIVGKDRSLPEKNDWVQDLEKKAQTDFSIQYTGGDSSKRHAAIIAEPNNPLNKVLQFWLNDSWLASEHQVKARVQTALYNIKGGYKEFYQSQRVFFTDDFNELRKYPARISWLTISEFWNNEWWVATEKYGFRITLGIGKPGPEESDLYFILNAENPGQKEVWHDNYTIKVPIGKWFTMDYYYKEGNAQTGRFYMTITPDGGTKQVVYDVTNFTHNTFDPAPNGLTGYNPQKLYTSKEVIAFVKAKGKTLQIYWDDFKLWKNKRPE